MKQPEDTPIGRKRKTLPTRRVRKANANPVTNTKRTRELVDQDAERELLKMFSEK